MCACTSNRSGHHAHASAYASANASAHASAHPSIETGWMHGCDVCCKASNVILFVTQDPFNDASYAHFAGEYMKYAGQGTPAAAAAAAAKAVAGLFDSFKSGKVSYASPLASSPRHRSNHPLAIRCSIHCAYQPTFTCVCRLRAGPGKLIHA